MGGGEYVLSSLPLQCINFVYLQFLPLRVHVYTLHARIYRNRNYIYRTRLAYAKDREQKRRRQ